MKNKKSQKIKFKNSKDLNYIIIKDTHEKSIVRKIVYSRIVFNFLLIALQLFLLGLFLLRLKPFLEFYLGGSLVLSAGFMIYLTNCKGKNEFKIAWLVPLVFFPFFGVAAYLLYHMNIGGLHVKRRLEEVKLQSESLFPQKEEACRVLDNFPMVKGIGHYLAKQGNYLPHTNTAVTYFPCGEDFFPDLFNSIKQAKKYIFLEFFIIDVDEMWTLLLEVLEQKVSEGVEVRVLYDGLGSPIASSKAYVKYLKALGIKAQVFLPQIPFFATQQNNRDHRKIVIIDGDVAFTGGINLANEYMNEGENRFAYWKDNAIRLEGSAIRNLTAMFLQTWNISSKNEDYEKYIVHEYPSFNVPGLVIPYGDDAYNAQDIAEDVYLYIISNAKKYIHITTPYMVIDNQMQEALIFAANRGVDVSIIVPSEPDHLVTFCIGKTFLKTLVENGIKVYLYEKGFIHAKTFISDDEIATVGSVNLDYRSLYHHFECGVLMYQSNAIKDIESDFNKTLNDCSRMELEDYKKIPSRYRMLGRVFRLFAPLT